MSRILFARTAARTAADAIQLTDGSSHPTGDRSQANSGPDTRPQAFADYLVQIAHESEIVS